jgi:hypothetical protein
MALNERLIEVFFADGRRLALQLRNGSAVIGEARAERWQIDGATASTVVRFGPFPQATEFDSIALMEGNSTLDDSLLGPSLLRQGMAYEHEYIVDLGVV